MDRRWKILRAFPLSSLLLLLAVAAAFDAAANGRALPPGNLDRASGSVLRVVALAGLSAFATIEMAKRLTPLRPFVQRSLVESWMSKRASDGAWKEPDGLTLRYDVPIETLAAQIANAADVALCGDEHSALVLALTARSQVRARDDGTDEVLASQEVRAAIDDLQITVGGQWRWFVQANAVWLSGLYGVLLGARTAEASPSRTFFAVISAVVGGAIAWTLRDVTAGVERWSR
ncbi:MAG TPA: hypothetical protein VGX28_04925 [Frankiaceae bacterium]|jgi:hypothetical protein|nr:hypothetical protein [Frankiaceae bacterium]